MELKEDEMRKAAGLTQAELAENLAVSQAKIYKIEHGEQGVLGRSHATVESLSVAFA